MARPLRLQFPGALYHVMSRGIERRAIVRDDRDRKRRLHWLERTVETYGWHLHAFVLMNNHEHLFVETPEPNLADGMRHLNGSYTSYFNRRHGRRGHLFQGRYRGHLIEEEGYFLEVSRYIHLNPVRAKLVDRPRQWAWGSYPGYSRLDRKVPWVTYERVLGEFGRTQREARRAYRRFVRAGMADPPPSPFADAVAGLVVGSAAFLDRVREMLGGRPPDSALPQLRKLRGRPTIEEIVTAVREHFGQAKRGWRPGQRDDDLRRALVAYLARRRFGHAATQVATALGYRGHSSVNYAVRRIEHERESLSAAIARLEKTLGY